MEKFICEVIRIILKLNSQFQTKQQTLPKMPLSTSGDVDGVFKPFRVVTPSLRLLIILSSSSAVLLLGWFLFALLPSRKAGVGVFVLPESIVTLYSPGQGYVYFSPQIKEKILKSTEISQILNSRSWDTTMNAFLRDRGGDSSSYKLVRQYQSVVSLLAPLKEGYFDTNKPQKIKNGIDSVNPTTMCQEPNRPLAFLLNNDSRSELVNALTTGVAFSEELDSQQGNYNRAISEATRIYDQNRSLANSANDLYKEGIISRASLAQYMATQAQDFTDVIDIRSNKSTNFRNALAAFLDATNKLKTFLSQSYLLAPNTACVVSQIVAPGSFVEPNTPILITTTAKGSYPDVIPVYIDAQYIADVKVGNEAVITPAGFSSTQYGGIKGEVIDVSETTQTAGQILKTLGVDTVAQTIQKSNESPFLVLVRLKKTGDTTSGYEWTSSKGPDFKIPITTIMNATIITKRISPASMALPALRNLFTSNPLPSKEAKE